MSSGSGTNPGNITADSANSTNTAAPNTRTYNASRINEFNESAFNGPTTFVNTNNYLLRGRRKHRQTCEVLQNLVPTVDWTTLSRHLSFVDQDSHLSTNVPLDQNSPEFPWITKDIDFIKWEADEKSQALWLSGPRDGMKDVASQVIAKEKAIRPNGCTLYFFCASAGEARRSIATIFAHTLLSQIVSFSGAGDQAITTAFLMSLLEGHIQRSLSGFKKDDTLDTTVKKILGVPDEDLHIALVKVIAIAKLEDFSLIIDGISIDVSRNVTFVRNVSLLVRRMMDARTTRFKALLTSPQDLELRGFLGQLPSIEFDQERKECLRFLQDHDGTRYGKITREHGGSLDWLWQNEEYRSWAQSTTSNLLYLEGKPGSGKSTLAKYLERNLVEKVPDSKSGSVVYYFYTHRGTSQEATHRNMLRSILHSILTQDESVFYHFQPEFRRFRHHPEWPYESLKSILSSLADHVSPKPLYLILDAIDESMEKDRMEVVGLLCKLCSAKGFRAKAFIASRPVAGLKHLFTKWCQVVPVIRLQDENTSDICKFTDDFLSELDLSDLILREIGEYIKANAEGVFVWVQLVKAELSRLKSIGLNDMQLSDHLKCLPRELEEFYKVMLDRLEAEGGDDEIQDATTLFQFVLFSSRPLAVAELQHILAFRASERDSSATPAHDKFQRHLSNAIEVRIAHCGGNFLDITADGTVQLMHQTAREFLLQITQHAPGSQFDLSSQRAHGVIATTSIQYLMLCLGNPDASVKDTLSDIKTWGSDEFRGYATYLSKWPWINYAIFNLYYHQESCDRKKHVLGLVGTLVKRLTGVPGTAFLGKWVANHHGKGKHRHGLIGGMASRTHLRDILTHSTSDVFNYRVLDAAAALDFPQVFELVQTVLGVPGEVLLISSVTKGLAAASRELIKRGDNINAVDAAGRSALHHAAEIGDVSMVRLLKEEGATWDIEDKKGIRPIDVAAKASGIRGDRFHVVYEGFGDGGRVVGIDGVIDFDDDGFHRIYDFLFRDGFIVNDRFRRLFRFLDHLPFRDRFFFPFPFRHRLFPFRDRLRLFPFRDRRSFFFSGIFRSYDFLFRRYIYDRYDRLYLYFYFRYRAFDYVNGRVGGYHYRRDELPPLIQIMLFGDEDTIEPTQGVGN